VFQKAWVSVGRAGLWIGLSRMVDTRTIHSVASPCLLRLRFRCAVRRRHVNGSGVPAVSRRTRHHRGLARRRGHHKSPSSDLWTLGSRELALVIGFDADRALALQALSNPDNEADSGTSRRQTRASHSGASELRCTTPGHVACRRADEKPNRRPPDLNSSNGTSTSHCARLRCVRSRPSDVDAHRHVESLGAGGGL